MWRAGISFRLGITGFSGDLVSPSYAVVFAIDYELISIGRGFRQHGFIDPLDRNAKFRVVKFLLQNHQEVGRFCIKREEFEELIPFLHQSELTI
jgi:hypothetical protein